MSLSINKKENLRSKDKFLTERQIKKLKNEIEKILLAFNLDYCFYDGNNLNALSDNNLNEKLLFFINIKSVFLFNQPEKEKIISKLRKNFDITQKCFCLIGSKKNKNTDNSLNIQERTALVLLQCDKSVIKKINNIQDDFHICKLENLNEKNIMFSIL